jgi:predicted transposase YbfD/YdcC
VESEVERGGKLRHERRSDLCSRTIGAKDLAHAVPCHWHIENRLHRVLDAVFRDDRSRSRTGYGPQNMATFRHMARNRLQHAKHRHSMKVRRKSAAWDTTDLEAVIRVRA